MSAQDYTFDPTGVSPSNRVVNEEHVMTGTLTAIALHGSFYKEGLVVEAKRMVNQSMVTEVLEYGKGYVLSPVYLRPSAVAGKAAHSYVTTVEQWEMVNLSYQAVGGANGADIDLLSRLSEMDFDRTNLLKWMSVLGSKSYNPRSRNPELSQTSEIEIFNDGLEKIKDAIKTNTGGGDKATNAQVTSLELRQGAVEASQGEVVSGFTEVSNDFSDIVQQFNALEDLVTYGPGGNTTVPGGYVYLSSTEMMVHGMTHGLDSTDLDITMWVRDGAGLFSLVDIGDGGGIVTDVAMDSQVVTVTCSLATELLVVLRPVLDGVDGFIYTSSGDQTLHPIRHELNSGFLSSTVWIDNQDGTYSKADGYSKIINANKTIVEIPTPEYVKVVTQRPLENSFIYKSRAAATTHTVTHNLSTAYVGIDVWVEGANGHYTRAKSGVVINSNTTFTVTVSYATKIKVLVQPVLLSDATFEQNIDARQTLIEDRLDHIQNQIYNMEDTGGGVEWYTYDSISEATNHVVTHGLNTDTPNTVVWVEGADGIWRNDSVNIEISDVDVITVKLLQPAMVKARVSVTSPPEELT